MPELSNPQPDSQTPAIPQLNPKHRKFAELVASGMEPVTAYRSAVSEKTKDEAARVSAARLLRMEQIATLVEQRRPFYVAKAKEAAQVADIAVATASSIQDKAKRLISYDQDFAAICELQRIRRESAQKEHADVPEAATGLVAVSEENIGGGKFGRDIKVSRFDAALMREKRELRKQMSIEVGDWTEKTMEIPLDLDAWLNKMTPDQRAAALAKMEAKALEYFGGDAAKLEAFKETVQ